MDFDNFTPIEETNILTNIEKNRNGTTVFIPSGYSSILIPNNDKFDSRNMIKKLPKSNLEIPAFILNLELLDIPSNEKVKKPPNAFILFRKDYCDIVTTE